MVFTQLTQSIPAAMLRRKQRKRLKNMMVYLVEDSAAIRERLRDMVMELDPNTTVFEASSSPAAIVGILEKLGKNMSRTLNLTEQLMPRSSKLRVLLQLVPASGRLDLDGFKVRRPAFHLGGSARESNSAKP